jgi:hypothetical protein
MGFGPEYQKIQAQYCDSIIEISPNRVSVVWFNKIHQLTDKRRCDSRRKDAYWDNCRKSKKFWDYNRLQAPHYSLGGYSQRRAGRAPDRTIVRYKIYYTSWRLYIGLEEVLSLYSNTNSNIASGATPIGSADRASDELKILALMQE